MCEKHAEEAIASFQAAIIEMARQLEVDDAKKLLGYLNILHVPEVIRKPEESTKQQRIVKTPLEIHLKNQLGEM